MGNSQQPMGIKYRIVESNYYNLGDIKDTEYIVEQRHKFWWWEWWSTVLTQDINQYDESLRCDVELKFSSFEQAEEAITKLNNNKPMTGWVKTVVKEYEDLQGD